MKITLAITLILYSFTILPHGGGTKGSGPFKGCHNNRKSGGFHCHSKSSFNGMIWASQEAAYTWLNSKGKTPKKSPSKVATKAYHRKYFKHWIDSDGDCQDLRAELLIERSLVKVGFKPGSKGPKCLVKTGKWKDFYHDEVLTDADLVDIDHIVPLKHAWDLGASNWSSKKRQDFANDVENLVITNRKYNRQKSAQTPATWLPINKDYACKYVKKWKAIKAKHKLRITKEEKVTFGFLKCE